MNKVEKLNTLEEFINISIDKFRAGDYKIHKFKQSLFDYPSTNKITDEGELFTALETYLLYTWASEHNDYRFEQYFTEVPIPNDIHITLYGITFNDILNIISVQTAETN